MIDQGDVKNEFIKMRVSKNERLKILERVEQEFEGASVSNCMRILWGLEPLSRNESLKGNKNAVGNKQPNKGKKTPQKSREKNNEKPK